VKRINYEGKVRGASHHHRRPKSRGGTTCPANISWVDARKHQAWHMLFENHGPEEIARHINEVWLDPDWEFVPRRKT